MSVPEVTPKNSKQNYCVIQQWYFWCLSKGNQSTKEIHASYIHCVHPKHQTKGDGTMTTQI